MPLPIENRLGLLTRGDRINVILSTTDGVKDRQDCLFMSVWPKVTIPLRLDVIGPQGEEGFYPFAGSSKGVVSISTARGGEIIFNNPNIPLHYFRPISMQVPNKEVLELLNQRKVDMGLVSSIDDIPR